MKIRLKGDEKLIVVDYRKKPQTRPTEIRYGLELPVVLEFYHDNDSAFTEAELSIFTSFQFAVDKDLDFTTNPPVLANNSTTTFVIAGNTISFTAMTDTAAYKALIGDSLLAEAYGEFKAYKPGKTRPTLAPVFDVVARNAVAADGSEEPPASPELYITIAEAYALIADCSKCYPPTAPLTFTKANVDATTKLLPVPHGLGQRRCLSVTIEPESGEQFRFDKITSVDDDNLNIDCTSEYDDMAGNYYLRVRK
jgi:hypothetical protein